MKTRSTIALAVLALSLTSMLLGSTAMAQLAVSTNDGKQTRPGDNPPGPVADMVAVIDLNHYPPRLLGQVNAPNSLTGAPTGVAIAPDESYVLVSGEQKLDPADNTKIIPDDTLAVIDLANPSAPKVIQTVTGLPSAHGISINKAGTLALVAANGAISAFTIAGKHLTLASSVKTEGCQPSDVVFRPDGASAFAVCGSKIVGLTVTGSTVALSGKEVVTGGGAYGAVVTPDGRYEVNADLNGIIDPNAPPAPPPGAGGRRGGGGGGSRIGAISAVDLNSMTLSDAVLVGPTPESVSRSPDGKFIAATVANNTAISPLDPTYPSLFGLLKIFRLDGGKFTPLTEAHTGHWCQGSVWNKAGTVVVLECAGERDLEVFKFDGKTLTRDPAATITLSARPGAFATAAGH
jgi:hypothetical protein